jgi:hypothetical protein
VPLRSKRNAVRRRRAVDFDIPDANREVQQARDEISSRAVVQQLLLVRVRQQKAVVAVDGEASRGRYRSAAQTYLRQHQPRVVGNVYDALADVQNSEHTSRRDRHVGNPNEDLPVLEKSRPAKFRYRFRRSRVCGRPIDRHRTRPNGDETATVRLDADYVTDGQISDIGSVDAADPDAAVCGECQAVVAQKASADDAEDAKRMVKPVAAAAEHVNPHQLTVDDDDVASPRHVDGKHDVSAAVEHLLVGIHAETLQAFHRRRDRLARKSPGRRCRRIAPAVEIGELAPSAASADGIEREPRTMATHSSQGFGSRSTRDVAAAAAVGRRRLPVEQLTSRSARKRLRYDVTGGPLPDGAVLSRRIAPFRRRRLRKDVRQRCPDMAMATREGFRKCRGSRHIRRPAMAG